MSTNVGGTVLGQTEQRPGGPLHHIFLGKGRLQLRGDLDGFHQGAGLVGQAIHNIRLVKMDVAVHQPGDQHLAFGVDHAGCLCVNAGGDILDTAVLHCHITLALITGKLRVFDQNIHLIHSFLFYRGVTQQLILQRSQ